MEPLPRVVANRFEQAIADPRRVGPGDRHQGFVHQLGEDLEYLARGQRRTSGHGLGQLEREASEEQRQATKQRPFVLGQQGVAPIQHRTQGAMSGQRGAPAAGKHSEAVIQALDQLIDAQHLQAAGGQLEGQGDPIQRLTQADHGRKIGRCQAERRQRSGGALHEQQDTGRGLDDTGVEHLTGETRNRKLQGRDLPHHLARDAQRLGRGGQDPQVVPSRSRSLTKAAQLDTRCSQLSRIRRMDLA